MLKFKIENFDKLPNGGPLEYQVDRRGFDLGRDQHLDWSLPDKSRVVSGKHCEIRFHDNAYWLYDTSTNGTFLNNSIKRVQSPYRLKDGDKLAIGEYVVSVSVKTLEIPQVEPAKQTYVDDIAAPVSRNTENIWDAPHAAPPPIDRRSLMPRQPEQERAPDFLNQVANIPAVFEPDSFRKRMPAGATAPAADTFNNASVFVQPMSAALPAGAKEATSSQSEKNADISREFLVRFAKGAGIPADSLAGNNAGDLAELSGQLLNFTALHLMSLLQARAEAKALSRSGSRTMIQSVDNNPLKFTPTPQEALRIMLGPKTKGYLDAMQTLESSFADLKLHQMATLAAMQTAVTKLFEGMAPDAIAKSAENRKSLLAGAKGKQWDSFVQIWSKKADKHEHGMLGAFLDLFSEHYDKFTKPQK